jgi:hypothetical protein
MTKILETSPVTEELFLPNLTQKFPGAEGALAQ